MTPREFIVALITDYDKEDHPEPGWREYEKFLTKWESKIKEVS